MTYVFCVEQKPPWDFHGESVNSNFSIYPRCSAFRYYQFCVLHRLNLALQQTLQNASLNAIPVGNLSATHCYRRIHCKYRAKKA